MSITVSICVATCGSDEWADLALSWALPSTEGQNSEEVLCRHYPELSVAEARNALVKEATGDLIVNLDADDQLCDGYVDAIRIAHARVIAEAAFHAPDVKTESGPRPTRIHEPVAPCLFVPALGLCDQDGVCLTTPRIPDWDRWPELNCMCIGTAVPRAMFLEVGGFDPQYEVFEDYALFAACVRAGARLVPVPDAVYCATRNPNGRNLAPLDVRAATYEAIRGRYDMASIPRTNHCERVLSRR